MHQSSNGLLKVKVSEYKLNFRNIRERRGAVAVQWRDPINKPLGKTVVSSKVSDMEIK